MADNNDNNGSIIMITIRVDIKITIRVDIKITISPIWKEHTNH